MSKDQASNAIDESSKSVREDFFRNNSEFIEKGVETSFKTLNTNLFSTINSAFSNFNNDYERKLDRNREVHEKAIGALTKDFKKIKEDHSNKKICSDKQEESIEYILSRLYKLKTFSKIFKAFQQNSIKRLFKDMKNRIIVDKFVNVKKRRNIFNSWRNITNSMSKGRIKMKYGKIFNDKYTELQSGYLGEIRKLEEILQSLEIDIKRERDERRALAKLYDENMNKGVEVFVKETNAIVDFNSSSKIILFY
jgi:hypothetical protein